MLVKGSLALVAIMTTSTIPEWNHNCETYDWFTKSPKVCQYICLGTAVIHDIYYHLPKKIINRFVIPQDPRYIGGTIKTSIYIIGQICVQYVFIIMCHS